MKKLTTSLLALAALSASNFVNAADYDLDIKGAHAFINFNLVIVG